MASPPDRQQLLRRATHLLATALLLEPHALVAEAAAEAATRGLTCLEKARSLDQLTSAGPASSRAEQQALARQAAAWRERLVR